MNLFDIENLRVSYGPRTVLDLPGLGFEEGRIHAVMGGNGAGKTTLFMVMGFLRAPDAGEVRFSGEPVRFSETRLQPLRKQVVLVPQNPVLFTGSVKKNVGFGLKVRGVSKKEREKAVMEALELVGMEDFLNARAHRLSGGETQRVALARALALSPRALLCDEPTASVDQENQEAVIRILRAINRERGITILFTSHDAPWAERLAHEKVVLEKGRISGPQGMNVLAGAVIPGDRGPEFRVGGLVLPLNLDDAPRGPCRLALDTERISLEKREGSPVTVTRLARSGDRISVTVDAGAPVTLLLTPGRYSELDLKLGDPVDLVFPKGSVRILP